MTQDQREIRRKLRILRYAEEHVKIGQPETGLGGIAGWSETQRAVRRFRAQNVRRMALFGQILTAEETNSAGIVDAIAPTGRACCELCDC